MKITAHVCPICLAVMSWDADGNVEDCVEHACSGNWTPVRAVEIELEVPEQMIAKALSVALGTSEPERPAVEGYVPGMRDEYPDLCWRQLEDAYCCIRERGHDFGAHEPAAIAMAADIAAGPNVRRKWLT